MADKIVAEYTVKVDGALKNLDKLAARVRTDEIHILKNVLILYLFKNPQGPTGT